MSNEEGGDCAVDGDGGSSVCGEESVVSHPTAECESIEDGEEKEKEEQEREERGTETKKKGSERDKAKEKTTISTLPPPLLRHILHSLGLRQSLALRVRPPCKAFWNVLKEGTCWME